MTNPSAREEKTVEEVQENIDRAVEDAVDFKFPVWGS